MEFSKELLKKAENCKSKEEIAALAKSEGVELSDTELDYAYDKITADNKKGELNDDELNSVNGGCGSVEGQPAYAIGDKVLLFHKGDNNALGTIKWVSPERYGLVPPYYYYTVEVQEKSGQIVEDTNVPESRIHSKA